MSQMAHKFDSSILREYDIRGIVGETVHAADARAIGRTLGTLVRRKGGKHVALGYDGRLSSPELAAACIEGLTAAGIEINEDSIDVSARNWRKVIDVNLTGTFFSAQAFGRGLLTAGVPGSAVLISSMSGEIVNVPQWAASYNSSKAAVAHLAKSLAVEWAASDIRVNSIAPGYVLTDLTKEILEREPELEADWVARIPQGRMAMPEDLTGLVIFLASEASSYLTAQQIVIDGGYTAV